MPATLKCFRSVGFRREKVNKFSTRDLSFFVSTARCECGVLFLVIRPCFDVGILINESITWRVAGKLSVKKSKSFVTKSD